MILFLDLPKVGRRMRTAKALGLEVHHLPGFEHHMYVRAARPS